MRSALARSLAAALQRGAMVIGGVRRRPRRRRDFCAPLGLGPLHRTLSVPFGPLWRRVLAGLLGHFSGGLLSSDSTLDGRCLRAHRCLLFGTFPLGFYRVAMGLRCLGTGDGPDGVGSCADESASARVAPRQPANRSPLRRRQLP